MCVCERELGCVITYAIKVIEGYQDLNWISEVFESFPTLAIAINGSRSFLTVLVLIVLLSSLLFFFY